MILAPVWLLSVVLLTSVGALAGPTEASDGGVSDAAATDAGLSDAGVEGVDAADAGESPEQRAGALRKLLEELELLARGESPTEAFIEDLFPFDPRNSEAVELGRTNLKASIDELERKLATLRGVPAGSAAAPPGSAPVPTSSAPVPAGSASAVPAISPPDAGLADASVIEELEVDEVTLTELELRVAKARLAFLQLPQEQRTALLTKDAERKRLAVEKARANAEREKALAEQKRAEEARQKALAEAERARNELQRVLANESARMQGVRGAQAAYKQSLAERRQAWAARAAERQAAFGALVARTEKVAPKSPSVDALYDEIVAELTKIRTNVRAALEAYRNVPEAPRYQPDSDYESILDRVPDKDRSEVESNVRVLAESADELIDSARALAWETLSASVTREHDLNAKRIALLDRVTPSKRDAVLGFGSEGIAQLQREISRLEIEGRWYRAHAEVRIRSLRDLVKSPLWVGKVTWSILLLVVVVASVLYTRRRGPNALERLRVFVVRSVRRPAIARPLDATVAALIHILPPLAFLLGVVFARRALGESAKLVELSVPLRLLFWYASYRLFIVASHRGIAWLISGGEGLQGRKGGRSERILRSVRMVARYGFAVALVLIVAAEILGEGYLFHLVLEFAWLGAIPIFALLVRWWRSDIADAYLSHKPKGRLAGLVRSTRERWFGFFVAVAAFVVVLGQGLLRALRRFVLGFDQTRKALAFLFRRRLEKKAAATSLIPTEAELPEDVLQWFSEEPVNDETFALSELPGLDAFNELAVKWESGKKTAAMLVVGEAGFGKTSWLNNAALLVESATIRRATVSERLLNEKDLMRFLIRELSLDAQSDSRAHVVEAIIKRGPQIILIDDLHHLVLRGVGTYQAWDAFGEVVERTRHRTLWVATMGALAYQHVTWARGGVEPFRKVVVLEAWDEARVSLLINARIRESGYEIGLRRSGGGQTGGR